jgi:hypothetical protein
VETDPLSYFPQLAAGFLLVYLEADTPAAFFYDDSCVGGHDRFLIVNFFIEYGRIR